MAKVKITGHASGSGVITVTAPNTSTDRTITLPDSTGTILDNTSTLDATKLSGTLPALNGASLTSVNAVNSGRKNMVYNGAMKVAQRSTSVTGLGAANIYATLDRWHTNINAASAGRFTMAQVADAPAGFANSLKLTTTTADTSIAAGEILVLGQNFEGQDLQHLEKGTATAKQITVSFYVKGNANATYTCELYDRDNTRTINQAFAVTTAWNRVELTFAADTSDPLNDDDGSSLSLDFILHGGTTFSGGTFSSNAWKDTVNDTRMAESHTSIFDATSRTFFITGVQMEIGSVATDFESRSYGEELALCQRYYLIKEHLWANQGGTNGHRFSPRYDFPCTMRATPTITLTVGALSNLTSPNPNQTQKEGTQLYSNFTATVTEGTFNVTLFAADAEL